MGDLMFFWTRMSLIKKATPFVSTAWEQISASSGLMGESRLMLHPVLLGYLFRVAVMASEIFRGRPIAFDEKLLIGKNCIMRAYNIYGAGNIASLFGVIDKLQNNEMFCLGCSFAEADMSDYFSGNSVMRGMLELKKILKDDGLIF